MKPCFKCGAEKPLTAFYKHPKTTDGRANKCKECYKKDVRENRLKNAEHYRAYDINRGNRQSAEYIEAYRAENPLKYKAHTAVNNSIRAGKLTWQPCEICGDTHRIHAHHDDYSKPLAVRWLCALHHRKWHDENGEGKNG